MTTVTYVPSTATRDLGVAANLKAPTLARLLAVHDLEVTLRTLRYGLVAKAREEGESWEAIASALNVSKQAAQQRYGT